MYRVKILLVYVLLLIMFTGCANEPLPETAKKFSNKQENEQEKDVMDKQESETGKEVADKQEIENVKEVTDKQENETPKGEQEPSPKTVYEVVKRSVTEEDIAKATASFAQVRERAQMLTQERPELADNIYDRNYITRMDEKVISYISGHTFDTVTGQELMLEDILTEKAVFWEDTKKLLLEKIEVGKKSHSQKRYTDDYQEVIATMDDNASNWYFYMDATGICFYFLEETIYEYPMKYTIPYEELSGSLKEEYLPGEGPFIARMSCEYSVEPQEGVSVCLDAEILGTSGYSGEGVCLAVNNSEYNLYEEGYYLYYGYLMKRPDERIFLILCMDYASDDYNTVVFEVTDGVIQKSDGYSGARFELRCGDFENIQLQVTMWILGVRTGMMNCKLTENGMLEKQSEIFQISDILTTKKELPVMLEGEEKILPIGTQIELTGTNGEDVVYFTLQESGQSGEIHFDISAEDYGTPLISGIEEYAYFDGLIYAG